MYFKLCFYIANATNVFLSSILDILRERGIPHQISPSTYHPWCYSVVSPVLRSSRPDRIYSLAWGACISPNSYVCISPNFICCR